MFKKSSCSDSSLRQQTSSLNFGTAYAALKRPTKKIKINAMAEHFSIWSIPSKLVATLKQTLCSGFGHA
jgi:hypothetical protein